MCAHAGPAGERAGQRGHIAVRHARVKASGGLQVCSCDASTPGLSAPCSSSDSHVRWERGIEASSARAIPQTRRSDSGYTSERAERYPACHKTTHALSSRTVCRSPPSPWAPLHDRGAAAPVLCGDRGPCRRRKCPARCARCHILRCCSCWLHAAPPRSRHRRMERPPPTGLCCRWAPPRPPARQATGAFRLASVVRLHGADAFAAPRAGYLAEPQFALDDEPTSFWSSTGGAVRTA